MRIKLFIVSGAVLIVVVVCAVFAYRYFTRGTVPEDHVPKEYLPDFSLPDAEGNMVSLRDVKAPVRIVNFWASWSPYSREELPVLAALKRTHGEDIEVLAINRDTNPEDGRAFLASLGLEKEIVFVYDRDDTYYRKVGGFNMPETVFVRKDASIFSHTHGPMTQESIQAQIDAMQNLDE